MKKSFSQLALLTGGMNTGSFKEGFFLLTLCTRCYKSTVNAQCKKVLAWRYNYLYCILVSLARLLNEKSIHSYLNFI